MTTWIPLDKALEKVLYDPIKGYYQQKVPFGKRGDFVTAPEISSLFGEMIAIWILNNWQEAGSPLPLRIIEYGPGQGIMMSDILKIIHNLSPHLFSESIDDLIKKQQITCHLIEISTKLQALQAQNLSSYTSMIHWNTLLDEVPDGYTIILANEFFDALPIKEYILKENQWYERGLISTDQGGYLFKDMPCSAPSLRFIPEESAVCELCPGDSFYGKQMALRLKNKGGAALVIDYGDDLLSWQGETLQGVKKHQFIPLEVCFGQNAGQADLSHHVDFWGLREIFEQEELICSPVQTQRDFLLSQGIMLRAEQLAKNLYSSRLDPFLKSLNRLIFPEEMGTLFKVLQVKS